MFVVQVKIKNQLINELSCAHNGTDNFLNQQAKPNTIHFKGQLSLSVVKTPCRQQLVSSKSITTCCEK